MSERIPTNWVIQQLDLLLSGTGFNYYRAENLARADDLLVRQQASGSLTQAVGMLSALHSAYHLRYLPPPTRENPFPPAEERRRASDILTLRDRIDGMAAGIRGMEAPGQDKIWRRMRKEADLLNRILSLDYELIIQCEQVREHVSSLTSESWHDGTDQSEIDALLRDVENVTRQRRQTLAMV